MAHINDEKLRLMEDEMNRFEEEIGLPPLFAAAPPPPPPNDGAPKLVIGANTFNQVSRKLKEIESHVWPLQPPPAPFFIPPQVQHANRPLTLPPPPPPGIIGMGPPPGLQPPPMPPSNLMGPPGNMMGPPPGMMMGPPGGMMCPPGNMMGPPPGMMGPPSAMNMPPGPRMGMPDFSNHEHPRRPEKKKKNVIVLSATPKLYVNKEAKDDLKKENTLSVPSGPELPSQADQNQLSKKNAKDMAAAVAATTIVQTVVPNINQPQQTQQQQPAGQNQNKKKEKGKVKKVRTAGGAVWEDPTLMEWEDDDFRLFCGDLGNDVTDELLIRTFSKYPSFLKAKVVRDKRTNKTKGFGFVSFKDPQDFIRANKEMNGRYVGSRPIKLRKSNWKNRSLEVVRKKEKEKATLIGLLTGT